MSKGSYPVAAKSTRVLSFSDLRTVEIAGHMVYVSGRGWVYQPLPEPIEWIELEGGPDD